MGDPLQKRECANPGCSVRFVPGRKWARFCSTNCRHAYHTQMRRTAISMYQTYEYLMSGKRIAERNKDDA